MKTIIIVPGLELTEAMYEAAAPGVAAHAPEFAPLTWERFTAPSDWWLVPDDCGDGYKAELVLREDAQAAVKLNLWFLPDLRGGEQSRPHSHPWDFRAHVLLGGYSEDRYVPDAGAVRAERAVEHRSGGVNAVPRTVYHEVTEVHEPGRTLTLMVCGRGERGAWGYLDTSTGQHLPVPPDPKFGTRLRVLNPHQP
jgi:hypothetical protein